MTDKRKTNGRRASQTHTLNGQVRHKERRRTKGQTNMCMTFLDLQANLIRRDKLPLKMSMFQILINTFYRKPKIVFQTNILGTLNSNNLQKVRSFKNSKKKGDDQ